MKEILRYGLILGLICLSASSLLAVVNGLTEPQIKIQKDIAENTALKEVLPEGETFKLRVIDDKTNYYIAYDAKDQVVGFVIKSQAKGYSSIIESLIGLNRELKITNTKILSQNETPGLGSKILDPLFQGQFKNKNSGSIIEVQAITGATISSKAMINDVTRRLNTLSVFMHKDIQDAK